MISRYKRQKKVMVAVDCIILGFDHEELKILLIQRDFEPEIGKWSLMGGFLQEDETLDDSAERVLHRLTGLKNVYMEQLHSFSELDRDPVERTISVAYYALINIADHDDELIRKHSANWFSLKEIPDLIFDHNQMLEMTIQHLQHKISIEPVGFELLPEKFTMRQLQKLYEAILGQDIDKRNFIKKINALDILTKLDQKDMSSSKKGSYLYSFNKEKYDARTSFNFQVNI